MESSFCIPEISYGKFSEELHKNLGSKRIPISGALELTFKCNLNCKHCYCPQNPDEEELSTDEIFKIINEITEAGCLWLLFTGGEPLIRKDFQEIYLYAKRKGLLINLFTNGTLLTKEVADFLARWRPFSIEIPLYGIRKETYEKVVNSPHSFEKCLKGIELIRERNLPLKLKTLVTKDNLSEVSEIKKYAEELGVEFRHDCLIHPRLDGSEEPCQLRVSPKEVVDLDIADERRLLSYKRVYENFWGPPLSNKVFNCGAGQNSFRVDPFGNLYPCLITRTPYYNLRNGTFKEGWQEIFKEIRKLKVKGDYKCQNCELFTFCDQCPAWSHLEGGNYETLSEFLCEITHLRIEELEKRYKLGRWEVRRDEEKVLQA
ncbi:MAG: radical SAM protein [Candidatus Omnitrophica bacterium]|nr:radical SAM protein [Candidatus Omnitrophota bacterium]